MRVCARLQRHLVSIRESSVCIDPTLDNVVTAGLAGKYSAGSVMSSFILGILLCYSFTHLLVFLLFAIFLLNQKINSFSFQDISRIPESVILPTVLTLYNVSITTVDRVSCEYWFVTEVTQCNLHKISYISSLLWSDDHTT